MYQAAGRNYTGGTPVRAWLQRHADDVLGVAGLGVLVTGLWLWCGHGPAVTTAGVGLLVLAMGLAMGRQGGPGQR
jgi:hypothetical protein